MENYTDKYWKLRLENCKGALENNNFEVFLADNALAAKDIVIEEILPRINAKSVSWGDSLTLQATGILEEIKRLPDDRSNRNICKKYVPGREHGPPQTGIIG